MFFYSKPLFLPDPNFANVSLLLRGNGTVGPFNSILDESLNTSSLTINGDATLSSAEKKYGAYSLSFDGNGDSLTTNDISLGTSDFTIETWIRPSTVSGEQAILNQGNSDSTGCFVLSLHNNTVLFYADNNARILSGTVSQDQWSHIVLTRLSNVYSLFIDGQLITTYSGMHDHNASPFKIADGYGGIRYFNGHMDDVRVTVGVARYTSSFTVPTQLPNSSLLDPHFNNVSLLLTNEKILDESANKFGISGFGNATLSSAEKKYGTYSIQFDGSGDRLQIDDNANFDLSSGAFTVETWFKITGSTGDVQVFIAKDQYGSSFSWHLGVNANLDKLQTFTSNINGDWQFSSDCTINLNTWYHAALVGDGTNMYHYLNGQLIGTKNRTLTNTPFGEKISIGCAGYNNPLSFLNGYIDDLRVTKGVARYTSNFTPPDELQKG